MNQRQSTFLAEYLLTGNATGSAIKAGYSSRSAYSHGQRLLNNDEVRKAIESHQKAVSKEAVIKLSEVVKAIKSIAFSREGVNIRLKALDMLMKHLGGYENELKLIQSLSDDQLDSVVNKLMDKIS